MDVLTTLYREAFPHAARAVRRLGGELEEARDLFHDAIIIYLEKSRSGLLQLESSPVAYLVGITKILWLKNHRRQPKNETLDYVAHLISIPEDFYAHPEETPLLEQLKAAGGKCLQLLQAFYYEEMNMREIAETFDYGSAHSATVQKYKCLEKVRKSFSKTACHAETFA
ncbi:RNA polymerase sigma factor [Chitinophaga sp. GCM10012297]|uniref:Sigma-70 family RNA polymerase sigma factor n=1 Tax=Chitinophaga chungangae TaxID=2821488 RepID=A0ABS3YF90_9BACT|nr:sigma-70 family RNA polymerase sigma factor [Chitinophaga chungangae]MBO9153319.1 sigma-70 family RNA polymerase sigma factor [Chitinophaga chungangae]